MDTAGLMGGKANSDGAMLGSMGHHTHHHHHHHHHGHPHNPLRGHHPHASSTAPAMQLQQQQQQQQQSNSHHHQPSSHHHPHHHPTDGLTEVSVVDINASLAASAPLISPHVAPAPQIVATGGTGCAGTGHVPSFCNILNASNSSDLQAVAYNSLTQNVRCKSPPTLVDNLKNGTIG
uniref:Uncharacterized protein n=1 Tax=Anopheles dirus TaxID=7168 RepID=A0A182N4Y0_9DIPT